MTDRRTFIAHAIMAGAGLALGPVLLAAVKEKKVAGLQFYCKGGFFGLSSAEFNVLLRKHRLTSPSGH
jgi:hypothetical protein